MKDYWYTPLFIFILLYGSGQSRKSQTGLTCVSDYVSNISCVWRNSAHFSGQRCELVWAQGGTKRCELLPLSSQSHSTRSCFLTIDKAYFYFLNKFWLNVNCNGSDITHLNFHPGRHIKTQPPDKPIVSGENITWDKGSNFPRDVTSYEFQLQVKAVNTGWENAEHNNISHGSYVQLDPDKLTVGEEYQARVRVKPVEPIDEGYFRGQWSDWSPAVSWKSEIGMPPKKPGNEVIPPVLIIGFPILLLVTGLCLFICQTKKSKGLVKLTHQHVPDPSKYFQSLHTVHGGNFRKWLGGRNSIGPFLTPQSCDNISPVEVSDLWDMSSNPDTQMSTSMIVHSNQMDSGLENSGTSHASSSGFSNMGYFYSKSRSGSLYLESCPVYFTYHPDEGTSSTLSSPASSCRSSQTPSYQTEQPMSPDSGFDMPVEVHGEEDQDDEDVSGTERTVAEGNALVSFIMSLSQGGVRPVESFTPVPVITPWYEPVRAPSCGSICESAKAVVRPASMIEPCGSGYLTLKEMQ